MRDTIDMAREAGFETLLTKGKIYGVYRDGVVTEELKAFEALVRADEREQGQKWFDAVTAQHKAEILAEREDLLDELHQAKWQQRQHRRAMNSELGNPEFETDDEGDEE
jgi:hypothetical protein